MQNDTISLVLFNRIRIPVPFLLLRWGWGIRLLSWWLKRTNTTRTYTVGGGRTYTVG